jgi:hypothetical protein
MLPKDHTRGEKEIPDVQYDIELQNAKRLVSNWSTRNPSVTRHVLSPSMRQHISTRTEAPTHKQLMGTLNELSLICEIQTQHRILIIFCSGIVASLGLHFFRARRSAGA